MLLNHFTLSQMATNAYVLASENQPDCLIVDLGAEPESLLDFLGQENRTVAAVVLTHGHYDHIAGLKKLLKAHPQAEVIFGKGAEKVAGNPLKNFSAFFSLPFAIRRADRLVSEPEILDIAGLSLKVLDLPGHSAGSIGLYEPQDKSVYCGDTLFAGSIGRTDFPGASHEQLLDSIGKKLLTLPDETKVFPGHGSPTTIGTERSSNPFLNGQG